MPKPSADLTRAQIGQSDRDAKLTRLRAKKPIRAEHRVFLSDEPVAELRAARQDLDVAQAALLASSPDTEQLARRRVEKAEERHDAAVDAAQKDSVLLVFEALPRDAFHALLDEHQPTVEQREKGRDYNPDTFAPELIAATCVDPGFDNGDEVVDVTRDWNSSERDAVFYTALGVCTLTRVGDLGKGSAATRT